uniref:Sperm microtubule inner protein 11 n=1 Tax=Latimeria chalumnae TaxID=7897 RepID=M3XIZ9_LATCH|nr:PREDICTED: uncharacterized protein LOC106702734 isoform X2 [Latimeria chalumnae]|eukprot:XP_014341288.1 PREDICTED: uncharacterized protein LOC106702734 isoform X2 [Latimeria chalumnae]
MAFLGLTCLGYQNPIKPRVLLPQILRREDEEEKGKSDEKERADSKLPPVSSSQNILDSSQLHENSYEKYRELIITRLRAPKSPNQIYTIPLTNGQNYGWWMQKNSYVETEKADPWIKVPHYPLVSSEMTRYVEKMAMTNPDFKLF